MSKREFFLTIKVTTEATDEELFDAARKTYEGHGTAQISTPEWAVADVVMDALYLKDTPLVLADFRPAQ